MATFKPIFLLFSLLLAKGALAQLGVNSPTFGRNPSNFVPASPEVASFQRYGDLPVGYQKGTVDISVPLGSIKLKGFTWPISLSYHTGGQKVGDPANSAGLGWTLNAGGTISHKVIGRYGHDEAEARFLNLYSLYGNGDPYICEYYNIDDVNLAENVVGGGFNFLPDLTYINTPLFNLRAIGGIFFPATKIGATGGTLDEQGNQYTYSNLGGQNANTSTCYGNNNYTSNPTSHLTKVRTVLGEEINFEYINVSYSYATTPTQYRTFVSPNQCQRCTVEIAGENMTCNNTFTTEERYISKIESTNGDVIQFTYTNRNDLVGGKRLDKVEFKRKIEGVEELLYSYTLVHDYFGSGTAPEGLRLRLSEVKLLDKNGSFVNKYAFAYNNTPLPGRTDSKALDWFGYYNGQDNNQSLLPTEGVRTASATHVKAASLEKITYPTGGYTTLAYEMNPFGGLRIKELKDYTHVGAVPKHRYFEYNLPEGDGSNYGLVFEDHLVTSYLATNQGTGSFDVEDEHSIYLLDCYTTRINSSPVTNTVMNFIENEYYYSLVKEYYGDGGENGKIEYSFGNAAHATGTVYVPEQIELLNKKVFKRDGTGYALLTESISEYQPVTTGWNGMFDPPLDPLEARLVIRDITQTRSDITYNHQHTMGVSYWCKQFFDHVITVASMPCRLTKTTEKAYAGNATAPMVIHTNYIYEDKGFNPTKIETTNSSGQTISVKNYYPHQAPPTEITLSTAEQAALQNIADKHTPYYVEAKNGTEVVGKSLKRYDTYNNIVLLKSQTDHPTGGTGSFTSTVDAYAANGNPTQYTGPDGLVQSMLYDERGSVIAYCKNAAQGQIAATSFEGSAKGAWTYSGTPQAEASPTGKKVYSLSSGSITSPSLSTSQEYFVSYWSRSGQLIISGSSTSGGYPSLIATRIIGGNTWNCYLHKVTGVSSVTLSGSGVIDELRLYPSTAEMSTFTYEPLIGISSQCDANNRVNYYFYDVLGRLELIRNDEGYILKKICYNYQGQAQSCQ
jgi:small nuclear ribonucleoprotein (snRNP)-like protein